MRTKFAKLFAPTGSTLFNLACSDRPNAAFAMGSVENIVGDSFTGKTVLALSVLAECANLPVFDAYDFYFDDAEHGNEIDIARLYGRRLFNRLKAPRMDKNGDAEYSETVQDFHCNVMDAVAKKRPFIYVLDSLDALDDFADQKKVEEMRQARKKGVHAAGNMGMSKARNMSWVLRSIRAKLRRTHSLLIVISQTRDSNSTMSFNPRSRSGGRALKFYSAHEVWLTPRGEITATVRGEKSQLGNRTRVQITKNKLTGKLRKGIELAIYQDYGIDDIGSCIDWLLGHSFWKTRKKTILARGLGFEGTLPKLIAHIEQHNKEAQLQAIVAQCWKEMEDAVRLGRKPRYR